MLLEVKNARVRYGAMLAVEDVSIQVPQGVLVALVGANGAGKTTLLRAISGLIGLERGSIAFKGRSIAGMTAHAITRLGIGHVPEGRGVLPEISVADNLKIGAYGRKDRAGVDDDEAMVLQLFPALKRRWKEPASVLSGGEQQMLSIGRALMKRPELLIVDEMSLGLAPLLVQELMGIVLGLVERGLTVLCVEQNTQLVLRHAADAYVLQNGRVVSRGRGLDLLGDETLRNAYLSAAPVRGH